MSSIDTSVSRAKAEDDRVLLEKAAKAAGYAKWQDWPERGLGFYVSDNQNRNPAFANWVQWNPLTDDGDALRLAVKLGIALDRTGNRCWTFAAGMAINGVCEEFYENDPYAATRRAIVRAAAAIGEQP